MGIVRGWDLIGWEINVGENCQYTLNLVKFVVT